VSFNGNIGDAWIIVPNWERFQHYGDRAPSWIKNYVQLLSDDEYLELTWADRGVLHLVWLEFAASRGQLKASRVIAGGSWVSRGYRAGALAGHARVSLRRLNDAGWIEFSASKPLATVLEQKKKTTSSSKTDASARAEDSRSRPERSGAAREGRGRKKTQFDIAAAMTRNVGREYPQDSFRDELTKYELSDQEVARLEDLWDSLQEDPF
jgi:hypothetical protein